MNIPFVFGLPQIILLLIALAGIAILISSFVRLRGRRRRYKEEDEVDEADRKFGRHPVRRYSRFHFRWGRAFGGLILVFFAISLLWLTVTVQTYLGLTSDIKAATVRATSVTNIPHEMFVELILYDQNGKQTSDNTYQINGDEWMLQADIIKFPSWLNILGLHSGYKLTRLEGRYDDPHLESVSQHKLVELNGGDDNFFKTVQQQAWTSPFVEAGYGSAAFVQPDGKTYNVFVTQSGLSIIPAK